MRANQHMSTFFQKLTGIHSPEEEAQPDIESTSTKAQSRPVRRPPARLSEERKSTHVRVEEDGSPLQPRETLPEDEGELTVDIYDTGDSIVIQSTVAGVKPEDLDVSITSDTVTIRGRRERQEQVHEENYYYKELFWGTFSRSVILPEEIEDDAAEATLKHGLLSIRLPKKRRGVVQKLKVKAA